MARQPILAILPRLLACLARRTNGLRCATTGKVIGNAHAQHRECSPPALGMTMLCSSQGGIGERVFEKAGETVRRPRNRGRRALRVLSTNLAINKVKNTSCSGFRSCRRITFTLWVVVLSVCTCGP